VGAVGAAVGGAAVHPTLSAAAAQMLRRLLHGAVEARQPPARAFLQALLLEAPLLCTTALHVRAPSAHRLERKHTVSRSDIRLI
jgi:hypothetical protein